jgi:restriction system protein
MAWDCGSIMRRSGADRLTAEDESKPPASTGRGLAVWLGLLKRANGIRLFKPAPVDLPAVVAGMSWREFEALICTAFRHEGFRVDERGRAAPDAGIDLIAVKAKKRLLIQCKHWQTPQVAVAAIRELADIVAARKADGGVSICGGNFTREAQDLAQATGIRLVDGAALAPMLGAGRVKGGSAQALSAVPVVTDVVELVAPDCPKCGTPMLKRQATRGTLVGHYFWSCADFPTCSGIVPCTD